MTRQLAMSYRWVKVKLGRRKKLVEEIDCDATNQAAARKSCLAPGSVEKYFTLDEMSIRFLLNAAADRFAGRQFFACAHWQEDRTEPSNPLRGVEGAMDHLPGSRRYVRAEPGRLGGCLIVRSVVCRRFAPEMVTASRIPCSDSRVT